MRKKARSSAVVVWFALAVAVVGSDALQAAPRTRWDVSATFTSADGGTSSGVGTEKITWGDPSNNSAQLSGGHFYGDALPPTFSLFLTEDNGSSRIESLISGGKFKIIAQKCVEIATQGCVADSVAPLEKTVSFGVISTPNTGNPDTDPDAFVMTGSGLSTWVAEGDSSTFRLTFEERPASRVRAPRIASVADPNTLRYDLVDVSVASGSGFVSIGTDPIRNKIDLATQLKSGSQAVVDPASDDEISVVVLASPEFSPAILDVNSLAFGPASAHPVSASWSDVDRDGNTDLILQFNAGAIGLRCGETTVRLAGQTLDHKSASGWTSVKTTPCR